MSIPNTNEIHTFAHCANCFGDRPVDMAPREYASIEAGFTDLGLQVWCKRCECNIMHIDFEGAKHPANTEKIPFAPLKSVKEDATPDWDRECEVCGASPVVPATRMCGPCTFGESDTAEGNW